jgi:hypothetical protein
MASATMPWSSQISIVRQWMPIALSAWVAACALLSTIRTAMPRRASSRAWVSPAGPAPATSTSTSPPTVRWLLPAGTGTGAGSCCTPGASTNSCTGALGTGASATGALGTGASATDSDTSGDRDGAAATNGFAGRAVGGGSGQAPPPDSSWGRWRISKCWRLKSTDSQRMRAALCAAWEGSSTQVMKSCSDSHSAKMWYLGAPISLSSSSRISPGVPRSVAVVVA